MATTFYILPYSTHSHGAIMLADELDGKRIKLNNSNYTYQPGHVLINWGNGNCPYPQALNAKVITVINKVDFFKRLVGCQSVPKFAFTKAEAANLSYPVVCRTIVEGQDGQGIVVAETAQQLVNASLYTEYKDKTSEYRVHLGRLPNGEVTIIVRQKKFKSPNFSGDGRIWTGSETKLELCSLVPNPVAKAAKDVFSKFPELTFGAFDVTYDNSEETAYVLEINSAPMMTSGTTAAYAAFFQNFVTVTQPTQVETPMEINHSTPQSETSSSTGYTAPTGGLTGFVKAQIAAGHITNTQLLDAYTPPQPTQDELVTNYVNKLTTAA